MSAFFKSLGRLAIISLAVGVNAQGVDLRIMPLGASITFGVGSSDGNGYRQVLLEALNGAGHAVDYVGSQRGGSMADPDNEGFPGLRIEEVLTHAQADVPNYLPNLYTINLGTNDASQDFDLPNAGGRMGSLLDFLWSATPDATVILSTLIINLDANVDSRAQAINAQYTDLANRLSGDGRRIVLADMHGADGPQTGDMSDATHPNDNGFRLMSNIWARAIQQAADSGFLQPPV